MARVHRQVDILLQNQTVELLTLESYLASQGEWGEPQPVYGSIIPGQGAGRWQSVSYTEGVAAEGFVRLGSTKGYISISWSLPRDATRFRLDVETPEGLGFDTALSGPSLDQVVAMVTLMPGEIEIVETVASKPAKPRR